MKNRLTTVLSLLLLQGAHSALPWLHVDGKNIKDSSGNIVVLRGVSTESISTANSSNKTIQQVLDIVTNTNDAASTSPGWYTRIVRLPVSPTAFASDPVGNLTKQIQPAVDYATSKGLYVIIDLHFVDNTQGNDAATKAFWTKVAPVFKNYPNVLFEPYNEPINTANGANWASFKPIMQSYVDLIRSFAPRNLICAGSPSWDQSMGDASTNPLSGANIVYVVHMYNAHWHSTWNVGQVERCAKVHPMIMTEWGFRAIPAWPTETVTNYGKPITDWMENLGLSWTTWCASDDWAPTMFTADSKGNWTLQVGDCCSGGWTKDLLYAKRNSNQPATTPRTGIEALPTVGPRATANLVLNGRRISVAVAPEASVLSLMSLQGRTLKEYRASPGREIRESQRILPGIYVVNSGSGLESLQSKILVH